MPELICPYCKESFEAAKEDTESCRKAACVKANQRAKKRAATGVKEVKRGRPRKEAGVVEIIRPVATALVPPSPKGITGTGYSKQILNREGIVEQLQPTGARLIKALMKDRTPYTNVGTAGDVNALARNVILSKVPTKKTEDDSMEARVKRLEAAMKQFSKKKGGES